MAAGRAEQEGLVLPRGARESLLPGSLLTRGLKETHSTWTSKGFK